MAAGQAVPDEQETLPSEQLIRSGEGFLSRTRRWWNVIRPKVFHRRVVFGIALVTTVAGSVLYWALFLRVTNAGLTFDQSLWIPPELHGQQVGGRLRFELEPRGGRRVFFPGVTTSTAGVNGNYLGPTLRVSRGDQIDIAVKNGLNEMTTMHWHGMHVPAAMDGTPHQPIEPGESWTASFEVNQQASTLWYHPHPHGRTGRQSYQGVAGLLYIDDDKSESLDLPSTYGVDDIPLVIQDRLFDAEGQFQFSLSRGAMYGDTILVNGTWNPKLHVESRRIRFRLLNGSNARIYYLGFQDDRTFHQIATDGGFLESPVPITRLTLAPGERAEILVDFGDGNAAKLKSFPEAGVLQTAENFFDGAGNGHLDLLKIIPGAKTRATHPLPKSIRRIVRLRSEDADHTRTMSLGGGRRPGNATNANVAADNVGERRAQGQQLPSQRHEDQQRRQFGRDQRGPSRGQFLPINGKTMDMHRIDERVRLGDTEIWEVRNQTGQPHPFHIHLVQFQVLDRNGRPPKGAELGWKDTVLVHPGDQVRVIMNFRRYADPKTPYMYHCHIMEHEDAGMMGQFLVVEQPDRLDSVSGKAFVAVFVQGLDCDHCFEQVLKFDREIDGPVLFVTPETQPEPSRVTQIEKPVVSDPEGKWAGWLGMLHQGPFHGTVVVDPEGEVSFKAAGEEPYMDAEEIQRQLDRVAG